MNLAKAAQLCPWKHRRLKNCTRPAGLKIKCLTAVLLLFFSVDASSQTIPPSVNLPISNIPQQTQVWCWAAVAQQIIQASLGSDQTPPQCALVAMAYGANPNVCCAGMGNPACVRTGSLEQIQYLIAQFGRRFSSLAPPTDPMTLYNTLASGRPVILAVRTGIISSHVIVLTGMSFPPDGFGGVTPVLHINDPLAHFTQPLAFQSLIPIWMSAIVVY